MADYNFPRVNIETKALKHRSITPEPADTTVLFAPILTEKGPSEVTRIHSLGEFVDTFGNLTYERNGQMALNIYNWLSNGGTVYVYRLNGSKNDNKAAVTIDVPSGTSTTAVKFFEAKEYGSYYGNISVSLDLSQTIATTTSAASSSATSSISTTGSWTYITSTSKTSTSEGSSATTYTNYFRDTTKNYIPTLRIFYTDPITKKRDLIEQYRNIKSSELKQILNSTSKYVQIYTSSSTPTVDISTQLFSSDFIESTTTVNYNFTYEIKKTSTDTNASVFADKDVLAEFWDVTSVTPDKVDKRAGDVISNEIEFPIDFIMDAGYSYDIKKAMATFIQAPKDEFTETSAIRTDIIGLFDDFELTGLNADNILKTPIAKITTDSSTASDVFKATNIAICDQYFTITDNIFTDRDIYVTPSYYYSKLIPFNDALYGMNQPMAGRRRWVLDDCKAVNKNPSAFKKNELFAAHINYIEKEPRQYVIMSQRTHDDSTNAEYTALSFLNNVRVVERIKKDLRTIGRDYLFEFNDSTTLSLMNNQMNKYMNTWISNRTLDIANVSVAKNEYSDEAVDVNMNIRFHGSIEVINIKIVIE